MGTLGLTSMAHDLAAHSAARTSHIAKNVANADTPGYRAKDLPRFSEEMDRAIVMRATRSGHIQPDAAPGNIRPIERGGEVSPNGNDVSLETEMMEAASARQSHEMAISVYSSVRGIMSAALGRGR
ncbi:flagellar basal body rod protein FlgB [Palleronia sp.]|uniref:flagellar basal body rod protein FlgB n=1 Tax=Palleronia sp. TaxID=1940284 RepID=UPI0035C7C175